MHVPVYISDYIISQYLSIGLCIYCIRILPCRGLCATYHLYQNHIRWWSAWCDGKLLAEGSCGWISICQKVASLTPQHREHPELHSTSTWRGQQKTWINPSKTNYNNKNNKKNNKITRTKIKISKPNDSYDKIYRFPQYLFQKKHHHLAVRYGKTPTLHPHTAGSSDPPKMASWDLGNHWKNTLFFMLVCFCFYDSFI